jgi:hypothetical protein
MWNRHQFGKVVEDKINVGGVSLEKVTFGNGGGNEAGKPLDILGSFGLGKGSDLSVGPRLVMLEKTKSSAFGLDLGAKNKSGMLDYACSMRKSKY